jgi:hypothetical protein
MKIIIKVFIIMNCVFMLSASYMETGNYNEFQATLGRSYALLTSNNPERFIRITADGNAIHAEGFFSDAAVKSFYISTLTMSDIENDFSFTPSGTAGGSFTASFSGIPTEPFAFIVVTFEDDSIISYRIEYDDGWFFGDNGLAARTTQVVENYFTISADISEYYISATRNQNEINETRKILQDIVDHVTAGVTDDYQKAKLLNNWVAEKIAYDRDAQENEVTAETVSVANTLKLSRSVCIGITNTYIALLETAGIKAINIKGGVTSGGVTYNTLRDKTHIHEWAAFWYEAEKRWVYADPTWDRQSIYKDGDYIFREPVFKYFDITPAALSFTHRGDKAERRQFTVDSLQLTVDSENGFNNKFEFSLPRETSPSVSVDASDNNDVLFFIIGVMSLTAAILIIIIIKLRK